MRIAIASIKRRWQLDVLESTKIDKTIDKRLDTVHTKIITSWRQALISKRGDDSYTMQKTTNIFARRMAT
jgi:hypothetical protein